MLAAPTIRASCVKSIYAGEGKSFPGHQLEMTKPKPKASTDTSPIALAMPSALQTSPTLAISNEVANEFVKDIESVQEPIPASKNTAKAEAFLDKLVKSVKPKVAASRTVSAVKKEPEDAGTKSELIVKITMNANAFESLLKDHLLPTKDAFIAGLPKKSAEELGVLLKTMEYARSVGNFTNQLRHLTFMAASAVELGSKSMGMKTEGYAAAIKAQDDEIRMILQEISLERASSFQKFQRPELRLAMLLSTTLLATDSQNRLKEVAAKKVDPEITSQFKDL